MSFSWIPNAVTIVRIILVLPTAWLLWQHDYYSAFILMAIAGASDALDGWLARQFNWTSWLGAALDPLADKLLVAVMFIVFTLQSHIPLWVAIIVLGRDAIIFAGAVAYRILFHDIEFIPSFVSKANTALQIFMLLFLLLGLCDFGQFSHVALSLVDPWCFYLLAVLGIGSGVDYMATWGRKAWRELRSE